MEIWFQQTFMRNLPLSVSCITRNILSEGTCFQRHYSYIKLDILHNNISWKLSDRQNLAKKEDKASLSETNGDIGEEDDS